MHCSEAVTTRYGYLDLSGLEDYCKHVSEIMVQVYLVVLKSNWIEKQELLEKRVFRFADVFCARWNRNVKYSETRFER